MKHRFLLAMVVVFTLSLSLVSAAVVWESTWDTGTGNSNAALLDGVWDTVSNELTVVDASAVGLSSWPTVNALEVTNGDGGAAWVRLVGPQRGGPSVIPTPAVGDSLYYRFYFQYTVDDVSSSHNEHVVEQNWGGLDGGACPNPEGGNWAFEPFFSPASPGMWSARWVVRCSSWPDFRWAPGSNSLYPLNKHQTYRMEVRQERTGTNSFRLHARIYDAGGSLLYDTSDFVNIDGSKSMDSSWSTNFADISQIQQLQVGLNGIDEAGPGAIGMPYAYYGAVAVCTDDWCGPYGGSDTNSSVCSDGATRSCSGNSVGVCSSGVESCVSGQWDGVCVGVVGPSLEVCNSLDDDCDGQVDEGSVCGVCTDGAVRSCGSDVGVCQEGSQFCSSGQWGVCIGGVSPVTEVCNDGLDNDCDGQVDESCSSSLPGDFNLDGIIDFRDLVNVLSKLGQSGVQGDAADADLDGDVDLFDLVLVARSWQRPAAATISVVQTIGQLQIQIDAVCPAESGRCQVRRVSPTQVTLADGPSNTVQVFDDNVVAGTQYTYNVRYWDADWGAESLHAESSITVQDITVCTPSVEVCDGVDNDCDTLVDEGGVCSADPVLVFGGVPSGTLASGTTITPFRVSTNVSATCKFDVNSGVAYTSMSGTFWQTGGTTHAHDIGGLQDGMSYVRYVKCTDSSDNANQNDYVVSFSVDG